MSTILEKFVEKPERMRMGSTKLAGQYHTDIETIIEARKEARLILNSENHTWDGLPKVLVFDIETAPLIAYVWATQVWNARVPHNFVVSEWFMLTWSAKWLFNDQVMSAKLTKKEALAEDDSRITKEIWQLLDEADIVIAHNSRRFDIPNLQTRFLLHKLSPPKPYRQIDTLLIVRKEFGFTHNNLNAIAEVLGLGEKIDTTIELWKKCRGGDTKALDEMETYNVQDVLLLEEVYLALLPWIKAHPNVGLYLDTDVSVCSSCGSSKLKKYGLYITNASKFQAYKCKKCKSISRSRINCHDKDLKKNLLVPISR